MFNLICIFYIYDEIGVVVCCVIHIYKENALRFAQVGTAPKIPFKISSLTLSQPLYEGWDSNGVRLGQQAKNLGNPPLHPLMFAQQPTSTKDGERE